MTQQHKAQRHSGSHLNYPTHRHWQRVRLAAFFARNNPNRATRREPLRLAYAISKETDSQKAAALILAQSPDAIVNSPGAA